jgi:phosphonate transport system ATP-binding protein
VLEQGVAVALAGVAKRYGTLDALRPLSLVVREGERVAVVGPSGAGKTTLLRIVNTSLAPSEGAVEVLGEDVARLAPRALRALRAHVATVYQQLHLVPQASVMQNVVAGRLGRTSTVRALLALLSRDEAERVRAVLAEVGIADRIFERVDRLSGGEQQRVAIARALHQAPALLVADEPIASVDPARAAEIGALLSRSAAGRTLVVTTHRLEPLLPFVDRVIGLRGGALAFDRPAAALSLDDLAALYASERGAPAPRRPREPARTTPVEPGAVLAVGASTTPGELVLPRAVRAFVKAHPGVRVSVTVKDTGEITRDLLDGRIALAFVGARSPHPALEYADVAEDEIVLVAAPGLDGLPAEPVPPAVAARLPRVEREAGSGTRAVVEDHLANLGTPLDPAAVRLEVGTLVGLKAAVLSGIGVAFASRLAVADELEDGQLRALRIDGVKIPRRLFAAWRKAERPSPAAARFLEVARAEVAARLEGAAR